MIRYALRCAQGHSFDSWFADAATYDRLAASGHLTCAVCGGGGVEKAVMAPRVATPADAAPGPGLSAPMSPAEQAIRALRAKVEAESDYVGTGFAAEARAIHDGESDARPIWGQATGQEARDLIDDGIPVAPLPFGPSKTN